jgi:hypothetical protein
MSETNQAEFHGWAKVEVMGHQSHVGLVTTEAYGQAVLFRIDQPEVPEAEETLEVSDWVGEQRCPAGTVVKRPKIEAHTVLVGAQSIYRIIPCSEAAAMRAIRENQRRPLMLVRLPEGKALAAGATAEAMCPACGAPRNDCNCLLGDDPESEEFEEIR